MHLDFSNGHHLSTDETRRCLTPVILRELVFQNDISVRLGNSKYIDTEGTLREALLLSGYLKGDYIYEVESINANLNFLK